MIIDALPLPLACLIVPVASPTPYRQVVIGNAGKQQFLLLSIQREKLGLVANHVERNHVFMYC